MTAGKSICAVVASGDVAGAELDLIGAVFGLFCAILLQRVALGDLVSGE